MYISAILFFADVRTRTAFAEAGGSPPYCVGTPGSTSRVTPKYFDGSSTAPVAPEARAAGTRVIGTLFRLLRLLRLGSAVVETHAE